MIYKLTKKRTFTLDTNETPMVLMWEGDLVKIDGADVYIQELQTERWHLTIDMVTEHLMDALEEDDSYTE